MLYSMCRYVHCNKVSECCTSYVHCNKVSECCTRYLNCNVHVTTGKKSQRSSAQVGTGYGYNVTNLFGLPGIAGHRERQKVVTILHKYDA